MGAELLGGERHRFGARGVDGEAPFLLELRSVDRGVGGEMDDDVGACGADGATHGVSVAHVEFMVTQPEHVEFVDGDGPCVRCV